jgi:hypothetical protein
LQVTEGVSAAVFHRYDVVNLGCGYRAPFGTAQHTQTFVTAQRSSALLTPLGTVNFPAGFCSLARPAFALVRFTISAAV